MDMIRPAVPSLFVTGYNAVHGGRCEEDANGAGVIQKPYSVEVLSRRIREILDGKQPGMPEKADRTAPPAAPPGALPG
jgi:hypothetical protein